MRGHRAVHFMKWLTPGVILLQAGGCNLTGLSDFLQTLFLGVTAAGSLAILQNI